MCGVVTAGRVGGVYVFFCCFGVVGCYNIGFGFRVCLWCCCGFRGLVVGVI